MGLLFADGLKLTGLLGNVFGILSGVWVFIVADEQPTKWALVGGLIVISAVTWRATSTLRPSRSG